METEYTTHHLSESMKIGKFGGKQYDILFTVVTSPERIHHFCEMGIALEVDPSTGKVRRWKWNWDERKKKLDCSGCYKEEMDIAGQKYEEWLGAKLCAEMLKDD